MSGYSDEAVVPPRRSSARHAAFLEKPFTERALRARCARCSTHEALQRLGDRGQGAARLPGMVRLCAVAALLCAAVAAASAFAQSPGSLQGQIGRGRARERTLGRRPRGSGGWSATRRARSPSWRAASPTRRRELDAAGRGCSPPQARPRRRAGARGPAAPGSPRCARGWPTLLRERYKGDKPDFVTVVLHSDGFAAAARDADVPAPRRSAATRDLSTSSRAARRDAAREQRRLTALRPAPAPRPPRSRAPRRAGGDRLGPAGAPGRARPGATPRGGGAARARAPAAARPSASSTADGRRAPRAAPAGPGGPWAIPWPIVQCESGGQNLPPN